MHVHHALPGVVLLAFGTLTLHPGPPDNGLSHQVAAADQGRMIEIRAIDARTGLAVAHPMVCTKELAPEHIGAIGAKDGVVRFGGILPEGILHLTVMAPMQFPADTIAYWPPDSTARPIVVALTPRNGEWVEPECE